MSNRASLSLADSVESGEQGEALRALKFELERLRIGSANRIAELESHLVQKDEKIELLERTLENSRNFALTRELEKRLRETEESLARLATENRRRSKLQLSEREVPLELDSGRKASFSLVPPGENVNHFEKMVNDLQKVILDEEKVKDSIAEENQDLSHQLSEERVRSRTLNKKVEEMEIHQSTILDELEKARRLEVEFQEKTEKIERDFKKKLEKELDFQAREKLDDLQYKLERCEKERTSLRSEVSRLSREVTSLQSQLSSAELEYVSQIDSLREANSDLKSRADEAVQKYRTLLEVAESQKRAISLTQQRKMEETDQLLRDYEAKISSLERQLLVLNQNYNKGPLEAPGELDASGLQGLELDDFEDLGGFTKDEMGARLLSERGIGSERIVERSDDDSTAPHHDPNPFEKPSKSSRFMPSVDSEVDRLKQELAQLSLKLKHTEQNLLLANEHTAKQNDLFDRRLEELTGDIIKAKIRASEQLLAKEAAIDGLQRTIQKLRVHVGLYEEQVLTFNSKVEAKRLSSMPFLGP